MPGPVGPMGKPGIPGKQGETGDHYQLSSIYHNTKILSYYMLEWDWELTAKMASIFSSKMERKSPIGILEPRKTQETTEI